MKIGVTGCKGRMGQTVIRGLLSGEWKNLELAAACDREGADLSGLPYPVVASAEKLFESSDAVIDFSAPEATRRHIWLAAKTRTALVVGTTGLTEKDEAELHDAAKETAIVYAANMSVGVNLLMALVEQAASRLGPEWDIEIAEAHHRNKVDAPSGTALALGRAAQKGRGGGEFAIDRAGKRKTGDIGFAVQRGGDVVGEHEVTFFGANERVTLGHIATDRALFAQGALRAAQWLDGKPAGLYSMRDVLGL